MESGSLLPLLSLCWGDGEATAGKEGGDAALGGMSLQTRGWRALTPSHWD